MTDRIKIPASALRPGMVLASTGEVVHTVRRGTPGRLCVALWAEGFQTPAIRWYSKRQPVMVLADVHPARY